MEPASRPPSRSRLPGAVFVPWAGAVLVSYLVVTHPLPLRSEVPFGTWAVLVAAAAAIVAVIAGRELRQLLRESVAPLLLLVPLAIYPMALVLPTGGRVEAVLFLLTTAAWSAGARAAIRRWGTAGLLGACWYWFPARIGFLVGGSGVVLVATAAALTTWWPRPAASLVTGRRHWWPLLLLLPLVYLTAADLQRREAPYKYFSGILSRADWSALYSR